MRTLRVEISRAMHRRVVLALVLIAVGFMVFGAGIALFSSTGKSPGQLMSPDESHPAAMYTWWNGEAPGDGIVAFAAFFLLMGGLFGGASVIGAEWRAGTVTTALTWEPRRRRFHLARVGACAICAFVIGLGLQVMFLALLSVSVFVHGTTLFVDAAWWSGLVLAVLRVALLTSLAATVGASLATIGRNTAFGVMAVFAWMAVGENLVRGLRPALEPHLFGENLTIALTWAQLDTADFTRTPTVAASTLAVYVILIGGLALASFERRDITSSST